MLKLRHQGDSKILCVHCCAPLASQTQTTIFALRVSGNHLHCLDLEFETRSQTEAELLHLTDLFHDIKSSGGEYLEANRSSRAERSYLRAGMEVPRWKYKVLKPLGDEK